MRFARLTLILVLGLVTGYPPRRRVMVSRAALFLVCLGFWLVLSDQRTATSLTLGVLASIAVARLTRDREVVGAAVRAAPRFVPYAAWLLVEIVRANVQVVRIVLDPRLPIDPVVVRLAPGLDDELALTTFANSITLTPGTVTVDVDDGALIVHALTGAGAADLAEGAMARRVARVFRQAAP